jgi:hypothetical protein
VAAVVVKLVMLIIVPGNGHTVYHNDGVMNFLKLENAQQSVLLLDVRGVVVETTILGIGNTDAVVKLVISFMFFLTEPLTRLAMKMAQSSIYLNQFVDFLPQIRAARIQST